MLGSMAGGFICRISGLVQTDCILLYSLCTSHASKIGNSTPNYSKSRPCSGVVTVKELLKSGICPPLCPVPSSFYLTSEQNLSLHSITHYLCTPLSCTHCSDVPTHTTDEALNTRCISDSALGAFCSPGPGLSEWACLGVGYCVLGWAAFMAIWALASWRLVWQVSIRPHSADCADVNRP